MCDGFVVHTPAPVGELELPALNKRPNLGLGGIALLIPPARERHLDIRELARRILQQALHDTVHVVLDACEIDGVVEAQTDNGRKLRQTIAVASASSSCSSTFSWWSWTPA
jgi:hypothetical protein